MDKREMIERAFIDAGLMDYFPTRDGKIKNTLLWDALAEQAIVIEGKVEQHTMCTKKHEHIAQCGWDTIISLATQTFFGDAIRQFGLRGRHGTPGKAIAIIVPLED